MREAATHAWAPGQVLKLFKAGVPRRLEQHQPDWKSQADKVARSNKGIERTDRLRSA